jgi:hypothetical protein
MADDRQSGTDLSTRVTRRSVLTKASAAAGLGALGVVGFSSSVSADHYDTTIAVIRTVKHTDTCCRTLPSEVAEKVESEWNEDISIGTSYQLDADGFDNSWEISLSLDTFTAPEKALRQARATDNVQQLLGYYDGVVVLDGREYEDSQGRAHLASAGTDEGVAVIDRQTDYNDRNVKFKSFHEVGHLYGASHTDDETEARQTTCGDYQGNGEDHQYSTYKDQTSVNSFDFLSGEASAMAAYGAYDHRGEKTPDKESPGHNPRKFRFSHCSKQTIRNYIVNEIDTSDSGGGGGGGGSTSTTTTDSTTETTTTTVDDGPIIEQ